MHTIARTHANELTIGQRPAELIPPHVRSTFAHACQVFGFLVQRGESLTALDWIERIEATYAPHHKRERVTDAIKAAMLDTPIPAPTGRPARLLCACCGGVTRGRQWWNQDDGHGLCAQCADWQIARGESAEQMERNYGKRGLYFDLPEN